MIRVYPTRTLAIQAASRHANLLDIRVMCVGEYIRAGLAGVSGHPWVSWNPRNDSPMEGIDISCGSQRWVLDTGEVLKMS